MNSREYFEKHMLKLNPCTRLHRQQAAVGGAYRTITVERAWQLWEAARPAHLNEVYTALREAGLQLVKTERGLQVQKAIQGIAAQPDSGKGD